MPTTYNGVGTHYYGKKNPGVRTAACRSCHHVGNLLSYDTRLWFVVVFIPVIPLGRKRIIDQCPSCTRHFVADADTFEQARQLQTSGSLEQFRREPTPDAALVAHAQLLGFHEHEQAAEFRRAALERFPAHAGLRVGLAAQLRQVSSFDEAAALDEAALELQPDLPEARVGVAFKKMALGELDEARRLLDFLEVPDAGQLYSLSPLDRLASCYQKQGRHQEVVELAEHLLREYPQVGQQHTFRAFVRKSEKRLDPARSILPPREHSLRGLFSAKSSTYSTWQRRLAAGGVGLALLAAGLLINNEYIRRHRTLHVVNATGLPVKVQVDDAPPAMLPTGLGRLVVAEGPHRVRMNGPVEATQDVILEDGFFRRWSHRPAWVLNPGAEAVLMDMTLYYAENPRPPDRRLIVGKGFVSLPHLDYAFEEPPQSLELKHKNGEEVRTLITWIQGQDAQAFQATEPTDREAALNFAESRLRRDPGQDELLRPYLAATIPDAAARAEAFLKSGLDHRPAVVAWHRAYQTVAERGRDQAGLIARYDRLLAADPNSGALLYLRGRIEPDWDRRDEFYRRAIEADPQLAWPWLARGMRSMAEARWDESLKRLRKAQELNLNDDYVLRGLHVARLATGDVEALIQDTRGRLATRTNDATTMMFLCDALAASGQPEAIEPEVTGWINRLPAPLQSQVLGPMRAIALYQAGKVQECEQLCRENPSLHGDALRLQVLLALGRAKEAADDPALEKARDDPWVALAVSLGLSLEGQGEAADRWRERACRKLDEGPPEDRRTAALLRAAEPPTADDLVRCNAAPDEQALLRAVLAERFPANRAEYHAEAARFNLLRIPPYLLVRRAVEAGSSASGAQ